MPADGFPLESCHHLQHSCFQGIHMFTLDLRVQILCLGTSGHRKADGMICVYMHFIQVDTSVCADGDKTILTHFPYGCGYTYPVKAVLGHLPLGLIFFEDKKEYFLTLLRLFARHTDITVSLQINTRIRNNNNIINRNNCHMRFSSSFVISTLFMLVLNLC